MGFRDEFRGSGKTYAQWSLETTTETGLRSNSEQLKSLRSAVKSTFDEGISRVVQSQEALADSLRNELAYQTQQICQEFQRSSGEVVEAIQQMADYLGSGLSAIRWSVERHTKVSEETLRLLLSSLSNESRQYWEQGVACYESQEFAFAKERFEKALETNRTNSFAYEYLGFISVDEDNADAAIRNFDLARKFSKNDHHRAIALSHLARSFHAAGNLQNAVASSKAAVDADPEQAKFWYEYGGYSARSGNIEASIASLKEAIERDWNYWGVAAADPGLDCVRKELNRIFDELRSREKKRAAEAINRLKAAIEESKQLSGDSVSAPCDRRLAMLEEKFGKNNVHLYREIQSESPQAALYAYQFANEKLAEKNRVLTSSLETLRGNLRALKERSFAGFGFLVAAGVACVAFISISMLFGPVQRGPFRVFTATQGVQINANREVVPAGSSRQVVNENNDEVVLRLNDGDRALLKTDLLKFGRFGSGYVEDNSNAMGGFAKFFWRICIPIFVWIIASKLRKDAATSRVMESIASLEDSHRSIAAQQQEAQKAIGAFPLPDTSSR